LEDSVPLASFHVYLDGGLHAPVEYIHQETIIRGDELHPVISMASIMAKVSRDRIMTKFALEYPEYGFENHSGYGTKAHYEAIKKHGQTPIHRKSFMYELTAPSDAYESTVK
jgi:ribonuclease HII